MRSFRASIAIRRQAAARRDLEVLRTSDGDGAMLGLVLVYAAILVVAVATTLWKTLA
jgi:hypothetical protein